MYVSVCEKIQRTLMSSCAFARASSLRTEVMTASLRALRSFITMESILCYSSLQGRETETRADLCVEPHRPKMSHCRQRERTFCFVFFWLGSAKRKLGLLRGQQHVARDRGDGTGRAGDVGDDVSFQKAEQS